MNLLKLAAFITYVVRSSRCPLSDRYSSFWLPDNIAFRFIPHEQAAPLEVSPRPDAITESSRFSEGVGNDCTHWIVDQRCWLNSNFLNY